MNRRRSSPLRTPGAVRVELGALKPGGVLVAERRMVEIDGELLPLRLLTIEAGRPGGGRPASRRKRRNPFAPGKF